MADANNAALEVKIDNLTERVNRLVHIIDGNGSPGMKARLIRGEEAINQLDKSLVSLKKTIKEADEETLAEIEKDREERKWLKRTALGALIVGVISGFVGIAFTAFQLSQ